MVIPLAGRVVAAVVGGLLILASVSSVSGTLIVSRLVRSRLTRWVDRGVDWGYHLAARAVDFRRRDRLLATQAAAIDRKSTRLNSSHSSISYAVFCLKKK